MGAGQSGKIQEETGQGREAPESGTESYVEITIISDPEDHKQLVKRYENDAKKLAKIAKYACESPSLRVSINMDVGKDSELEKFFIANTNNHFSFKNRLNIKFVTNTSRIDIDKLLMFMEILSEYVSRLTFLDGDTLILNAVEDDDYLRLCVIANSWNRLLETSNPKKSVTVARNGKLGNKLPLILRSNF